MTETNNNLITGNMASLVISNMIAPFEKAKMTRKIGQHGNGESSQSQIKDWSTWAVVNDV